MSGEIDNLMELLLSVDESNVEIGKMLTISQNLLSEVYERVDDLIKEYIVSEYLLYSDADNISYTFVEERRIEFMPLSKNLPSPQIIASYKRDYLLFTVRSEYTTTNLESDEELERFVSILNWVNSNKVK